MRIIPVLDIAAGVAVHARAGDRAHFAPVHSVLSPDHPGDAMALLAAYRSLLDTRECYIADLDAIQGGPPQRGLIRQLADFQRDFGGTLLVDAGSDTTDAARDILACGTSQVIVGLETLQSFADLRAIVDAVGTARTVFGLDLRLDNPILHPAMQDAHGAVLDPVMLAGQALEQGVETLVVIDVGRVGTGCGADLGLLDELRRHFPSAQLLAGGGLLAPRDLEHMRNVGCDGVLIASALHAGRIRAADVLAFADRLSDGQSGVNTSQ